MTQTRNSYMGERHSDKAALRGEPSYVWRFGPQRRLNMIRHWGDVNGRILDSGCGVGAYLNALAPFSSQRFGHDVEHDRLVQATAVSEGIVESVGEHLPFASSSFDCVLSNEVIEHVQDDARYMAEMVRVLRKNGRLIIFCPNRWHWMEQHGIYWRGNYKFGNIPLVNYLPTPLRDKLAPHVKAYTYRQLRQLYKHLPVRECHHGYIFGGYDNIIQRSPKLGQAMRKILYTAEKTPASILGLSHLLVLEKTT